MSAISVLLNKIKTAVYGEEVRGAIHDSIEQCYDDVVEGSTLANAAADRATKTADRMDALLDKLPDDYTELVEDVNELKSAVDYVAAGEMTLNLEDYHDTQTSCTIKSDNTVTRSGARYVSAQVPIDETWHALTITANSAKNSYVTFVTELIPVAPTAGDSIASILATGETGRHTITAGTEDTLTIPADAAYAVISLTDNANDMTPSAVAVQTKTREDIDSLETALATKQAVLTFDIAPTDGSANPVTSGGIYSAIKDAVNGLGELIDLSELTTNNGRITSDDLIFRTTSGYRYALLPVTDGLKTLLIRMPDNGERTYNSSAIAFLTSNTLTAGSEAPLSTADTTVHTLAPYDVKRFVVPDDCAYIYILTRNNGKNVPMLMYSLPEDSATEIITDLASRNDSEVKGYYTKHLAEAEAKITAIQNSISDNNDTFLFVADYHISTNQGNSLNLMRHVAKYTGITSLLFAGDMYGGTPSSQAAAELSLRRSAAAWNDMARQVDEFWGVLGNHEWIMQTYNHRSAMFGAYLNRFKRRCGGMDEYGDYWFDNPVNKIRYIALQQTTAASVDANQLDWLGDTLNDAPSGSSVLVFAHHGYIPNEASTAEYDGATLLNNDYGSESGSHLWAKRVNQILHAYEAHTTLALTIDGVNHAYDFTGKDGAVIGVFCGHLHHGTLFEKDNAYNDEGITVFRGSTDTLKAASIAMEDSSGATVPWYWQDGTVGGTKVMREAGTVTEQCFYAVQMDLDAKKVYITAIGGDHDWEFEY